MIYFVSPECRPFVKIGHADDVASRVANLQAANPDKLVILGILEGGRRTERQLHERFAHLHVRGEWFEYTEEIDQFIYSRTTRPDPETQNPDHSPTKSFVAAINGRPTERIKTWRPRRPREPGRIMVWVQRMKQCRSLMLQWIDPVTKKRRTKSSGTSDLDEAEYRRADFEMALNEQFYYLDGRFFECVKEPVKETPRPAERNPDPLT